jgi:translation initiation factor 2 alpha subunit (eIF-2alpha)
MTLNVNIESSARRLFPNLTPERAIVELLLERAQKNLIKYQTMARKFKAKYGQEFEEFRKMILSSQPDSATEQDYFDWELAVTGIADMQAEIKRLKALKKA